MKFHLNRFLRRVRIHGGEFDTSARAMYRVRAKRSLITYEKAFSTQAEPRIVRGSTIERKQMSTKTSFKRVALVAVAALGLGVLASAPSSAAPMGDTLTLASATSTGTLGVVTSVVVKQTYLSTGTSDTVTATATYVSYPAGNAALPSFAAFADATNVDAGSPNKSASGLTAATGSVAASTAVTAHYKLSLTAVVPGDYVIRVTPSNGSGNPVLALAKDWTVTVAAPVAPTATGSRAYMQATGLNANGVADAALQDAGGYHKVPSDSSTVGHTAAQNLVELAGHIVTQDASASNVSSVTASTVGMSIGTEVANVAVIVANTDSITTSTWKAATQHTPGGSCTATDYDPCPATAFYYNAPGVLVTASISPVGFVTHGGSVKGTTYTQLSTDGTVNYLQRSFGVAYSGKNGVATLTISANGVTLATKTINFVGAVASYPTAVVSKSAIGVGAADSATITVTGADVDLAATAAPTVYGVSTDTTIATVTSGAAGILYVTGVKVGKTSIKICNTSACTSATITKTVDVNITEKTAKTVVLTTDAVSYGPGEKITVTLTATTATGQPMANGTYSLLSSTGLTTNLAVQGSTLPTTDSVTVKDGKASYTFYAPVGTGSLLITGTEGTATDHVVTATAPKPAVTKTVEIINAAVDAATAAGEAAEAAAQDATDAALDATTAAEAAGALAQEAVDLVTELSAEVTKLIAGVRASITYLTKLVMKLAAKK